ncbi:hypothetical protein N0V94_005902 [Neodidymelliopsis sp. IMI 364377]|nr:hypothetical protein N0V94_005902 [Neodidymelliopsis sp. IMI 364377]
MHLLQLGADGEFSLAEFYGKQIPPYAILSHTWIANHEEVTFKEIKKGKGKAKAGYEKLRFIASQATIDDLKYFWVDTCCIDKSSSAELQEAINSMFRWYQKSTKCYVYLADVSSGTPSSITDGASSPSHQPWKPAFLQSKWFTRGWTLQELLAPQSVQFFSLEGNLLGDKLSLWSDIEDVTSIPLDILQGSHAYLLQYDIGKRLSWAAERRTTREEDAAYSLLGLFDLHMPLLYGEGRTKAFMRLHRERESVMVYENSHISTTELVQTQSPKIDRRSDEADAQVIRRPSPLKRAADEAFRDSTISETQNTALQLPSYATDPDDFNSKKRMNYTVQNPSSDKVVRADIRVTSLDGSSPNSTNIDFTSIEDVTSGTGAISKETSMKMWWNDSIARNLVTPENYTQVAVLLIKWVDELDELQTRSELQEVEDLFRDRFRFRTEIVELNVASKPQLQLNQRISNFIVDNDGPNNLLIVYYIGHGIYRDLEHYLQLSACVNPVQGKGFSKHAHANWNKAEDILRSGDTDADVLTILDTCYAANVTRGRSIASHTASGTDQYDQSRRFELMSASAIDDTTAAPGPYSFTRALIDNAIDHLREHGDSPISTFHLNQRICMDTRRSDTPSYVWKVLPNDKDILLKPMQSAQVQRYEMFRTRVGGRLTLEFELRDQVLNQEQIEYLARYLGKAFRHKQIMGVRKINWLGIVPVQQSSTERLNLAVYAITKWKKFVSRQHERRLASTLSEENSVSEEG